MTEPVEDTPATDATATADGILAAPPPLYFSGVLDHTTRNDCCVCRRVIEVADVSGYVTAHVLKRSV